MSLVNVKLIELVLIKIEILTAKMAFLSMGSVFLNALNGSLRFKDSVSHAILIVRHVIPGLIIVPLAVKEGSSQG